MKSSLQSILYAVIFFMALGQGKLSAGTTACSFAQPNLYTSIWDSCSNTNRSINGYASFNSCFKYQWKVNNVVVGTSRSLNYPVTQNGTYNVCLVVIDSCKSCDTTICSARVFTCIPNSVPCSFAQPNLYTSFWDSCTNSNHSVNAYASFNSCFKYQWRVNNVLVGTTRYLNYPITQNGTYVVCLSVTDTCKHCDTTICSTRVFTCMQTNVPCNWNTPNQYVIFWDSCTNTNHSLNGYGIFNSCYKYQWKVNGNVVSTNRILSYPVSQNGTYNVCLSITDTCKHCDTTFCSTRVITCFPNNVPCNFAQPNLYTSFWDSCTNTNHSLNAYASFNSCFKYQWKVNNVIVGTTRYLNYPITQNGTYVVCLSVIDTCKHCDTTICSTRIITCIPNVPCHWGPSSQYVTFADTCTSDRRIIHGTAYYNSCYRYLWKVNGVNASTTYVLSYPVTQSGTYNVCLTITDTCKHCDTTMCIPRVFTCLPEPCHWSTANQYAIFWDSCTSTNKSINGYAVLNSCYKYLWKVNGNVAGTTRTLKYIVSQNGTYTVCLTLTDTCRHCDTTICSTRTFTCFPSNTPCNWSTRNPYLYFWDTCTANKKSLNAYIAFGNTNINCLKFQWKVNNVIVGTGNTLHYPVSQNGTYVVCVSVIDTCGHCDTSLCNTRVLTCSNTTPACNWSGRNPYTYFWDTCTATKKSVNGYIAFNSSTNCYKYQWKVNNVIVGTGNTLHYPVSQNGTYVVCVSVIDTCNHCDTSFCTTRVINCANTIACNWSSQHPYTRFWDSCTGVVNKYSLNGYITFNSNYFACYKYQWKVNGQNAGTGRWLNYPISENGTYNVCVIVTDTCHHCDTSFCSVRVITCVDRLTNDDGETQLKVYSNPTTGLMSVDWTETESASYMLTNSSGQIVGTGQLLNGTQLIDLSQYPTGLYLLKVQGKNGILTRKISLQKQ